MFERTITNQIEEAASTFYAVSIVGPRQSGKTTLLKYLFPKYYYINLEDLDVLDKIKSDPKSFFRDTSRKWIIDEAQEYPQLFSYLLGFIDNNKIVGQFILSGLKNFVLLEQISQSLAGRVAIIELLPLTYTELKTYGNHGQENIWSLIYQGSYPGPYYNKIKTELWYKSYITTYLQRDVRQLIKVRDLSKFYLFLRLCAGRHGQILNLSDLGASCGISHTTCSEWVNLLELSYIVFRLQPYYKNFNKRLIKSPKLYFYDSGLVCHLLGIESGEHTQLHSSRGALFEGFIISEIIKHYYSQAKRANLYFWNSHKGFEIDLLIEKAEILTAIEIKSSATFTNYFLQQLKKWRRIDSRLANSPCYVVYSGDDSFNIEKTTILSYKDLNNKLL